MRLFKPPFLFLFFITWAAEAQAQKNKGSLSGHAQTRFMQTFNNGSLEDYYITVSSAKLKYEIDFNERFTFGISGAALFNWGTKGIERRDNVTGSGPIYEANLWNARTMDGVQEYNLPELYLNYTIGYHLVRIGRILEDTPLINTEVWPLPIAFKGIWYKYQRQEGFHAQAGYIHRVSSRFMGKFVKPGESLGSSGLGVGLDGNTSQYFGVTSSSFIGVANVGWNFGESLKLDVWNHYAQNISNTLLVESEYNFGDNDDWKISGQLIYQNRVGDGGNADADLRYFTDASAQSLSMAINKKITNQSLTIAFSRIGDQGRLLLPREWGKEPFYTFQRRTRVEGFRDVTALQLKWDMKVEKENVSYSMFSSVGQHWLPNPDLNEKSKYQVPATLHTDASFKINSKNFMKGLTAELYLAYRFLTDEESNEPEYLINRADFFHTDFILTYTF